MEPEIHGFPGPNDKKASKSHLWLSLCVSHIQGFGMIKGLKRLEQPDVWMDLVTGPLFVRGPTAIPPDGLLEFAWSQPVAFAGGASVLGWLMPLIGGWGCGTLQTFCP